MVIISSLAFPSEGTVYKKRQKLERPYVLTEEPQEEVTRGISNHQATPKDLVEVWYQPATEGSWSTNGTAHLARSKPTPKQTWSLALEPYRP